MTLAINAVMLSSPPTRYEADHRPPFAPGDLLRLTPDADADGAPVFRTEHGLLLRLPGMAPVPPGASLMMLVEAIAPQLVLRQIDASEDVLAPGSKMAEPDSMRADQLALRQVNWSRPDPAWVAGVWLNQVRQQQQAPARFIGDVRLLAAGIPASDTHTPMQAAGNERWQFPLFGWGGVSVLLRLVEAEEDKPRTRKQQVPAPALRLEFMLPELGRVVLHLQWSAAGVCLLLCVEQDSSMPAVRASAPALADALARAGLRLHRLQVRRGVAHAVRPAGLAPAAAAALVPPALYRAGAEIMLVLASPGYR